VAHVSIVDAVQLILSSGAITPAPAFLRRRMELHLQPTQPEDHGPDPPGFPQYDAIQNLGFETDDNAPASLEVLVYGDGIIQARLAVHHRSFFGLFSKARKNAGIARRLLAARYGPGIPSEQQGVAEMTMFADDKTDAYLSRIAQTVFVNVGDRELWRRAGGLVI